MQVWIKKRKERWEEQVSAFWATYKWPCRWPDDLDEWDMWWKAITGKVSICLCIIASDCYPQCMI